MARRKRNRPIQTEHDFRAKLKRLLTDRQSEALETAYWSGFFEWPRESNGQEIAESLGVSQPTFNRHLRAAE
ncbi:helix-turn-helix domain-containing protein [Haladaptatus sp. NG-SE-30]